MAAPRQDASSTQQDNNAGWSAYLDQVFNVAEPRNSIYPPSYNMSVGQIPASDPGPSQRSPENSPRSPKSQHLRSPRSAQSFQTGRLPESANTGSNVYITSPRPSATRLYSSTSPPTSNISSVFAALGRTETTTSHWDTELASETDDGVPRRPWARIMIWVALLIIVIAGVVVGTMIGLARQSHGSNEMGGAASTSQSFDSMNAPSWTPAINSAVSSWSATDATGTYPTSMLSEYASQTPAPSSI
ncbi:hypothetical protein BDV93DRAFT_526745 [Ceratobasidium sp. AG-I]|nr:hypothetical protein BDV93DRAFT_526745 [Ceratobasidium sp. AG-I]